MPPAAIASSVRSTTSALAAAPAAAPGPRRAGTWARRRSRRARGRRRARSVATASLEQRRARAASGPGSIAPTAPSRARVAGGALADLLALALEGVDDRFQHHPEARHAAALVGREVGAAVEGHAVGVEEDGHRPAALAGHRLHRLHVDRVDVGALLAVDLDVDEVLVHVGGGLGVLEGLALHHVAPVAGRVADREQDRPVLLARPRQRLGAPGVPVDRVVAVLEQVGAGLLGEAVGHRSQPTQDACEANYSAAADRRNSSPLAETDGSPADCGVRSHYLPSRGERTHTPRSAIRRSRRCSRSSTPRTARSSRARSRRPRRPRPSCATWPTTIR